MLLLLLCANLGLLVSGLVVVDGLTAAGNCLELFVLGTSRADSGQPAMVHSPH